MNRQRVIAVALAVVATSGAGLLAHRVLRHDSTAAPAIYEVRPETVGPSTTSASSTTPPATTPPTTAPRRLTPSPSTSVPPTMPEDTPTSTDPAPAGLPSWLNDLLTQLKRRVR